MDNINNLRLDETLYTTRNRINCKLLKIRDLIEN